MKVVALNMISVLLATNRIDDYLSEAISSILQQTFPNIQLIIVANGSGASKITEFIRSEFTDDRLTIIETPIAQLSHALNLALTYAKGDYIARMDADDLANLNRLERQIDFLVSNQLDLVGCDLVLIDACGREIGTRVYPKGAAISKMLPFSNTFAHNTILAKKEILISARGYNAGFNTEDYDLWLRLSRTSVKWDNMSERLVLYRIHQNSSQRRLLGYAESTGMAMREFLLNRTFRNFLAIVVHFIKTFVRSKRV
jgi:glycosyltransferase involved in cell wall biosynthesis